MRFLAIVAMSASLLMAGCEKEENGDSTGGGNNNGGGNNGGGGSTTNAEWVDLGLPSGLLWASCNVGATAPEDYGDYFAWGETTTKTNYSLNTYRYGTVDAEGYLATLTKYNTSTNYGTVDTLTTLQSGDDAATANMGDGVRTPTLDEWSELLDNTTAEWTALNGVSGIKFTASNGKSIFLPAAGWYSSSVLLNAGDNGFYWSSSLDEDKPYRAHSFDFYSGDQYMYYVNRIHGISVRAVHQN